VQADEQILVDGEIETREDLPEVIGAEFAGSTGAVGEGGEADGLRGFGHRGGLRRDCATAVEELQAAAFPLTRPLPTLSRLGEGRRVGRVRVGGLREAGGESLHA